MMYDYSTGLSTLVITVWPDLFLSESTWIRTQLFYLIYSHEDYIKQLARQPGWQDILTKLYVKESYESRTTSISSPHPSPITSRPLLRRDDSMVDGPRSDVFIPYTSQREEAEEDEDDDEEESPRDITSSFLELSPSPPEGGQSFSDSVNFKSFDSVEQGSRSSSLSNTADVPAEGDEGLYQPISPFSMSPLELELGGQRGSHTPDTPSPLEHNKPFLGIRVRKSSSLSNVLDDTSYCAEPPTADTISNNSNPQVPWHLTI